MQRVLMDEGLFGGLVSFSYGPGFAPEPFSFFREELGVSCFATNPNSAVIDGRWRNNLGPHRSVVCGWGSEFPCSDLASRRICAFGRTIHSARQSCQLQRRRTG